MTYQEAKRKAKYGGYKHIGWKNKAGEWVGARLTAETLKQAMLDLGTQGQFMMFDRTGPMWAGWSLAAMWLRHIKKGYFAFKD